MISDMDRERQFDDILDVASGDVEALLAAARQLERRDEKMSADLRLIAFLCETTPSKAEIDSARLRVGQRLTRDILAAPLDEDARKLALRPLRLSEPPETTPDAVVSTRAAEPSSAGNTSPSITASSPRMSRDWLRISQSVIFWAVAAATLFLALGMGLTLASAQSLPESPLYGIKRAEEAIMLALPLDANARAQTLGMIAIRRLQEAQAEASAHHDAQAKALLSQYNDDMRQLIMLAASVKAQHGDSGAITAQIAQALQAQQAIQQSAVTTSDTTFKQALANSSAAIATSLQQQNISLPSANSGAGPNGGDNPGGVTGTPTASPTPTTSPTPTASPTPSSHGHGHGHGHGSANPSGSSANP